MSDPGGPAAVDRGSRSGRVRSWLQTLSWRRDLALPAVLLVVQLAGSAATAGQLHHHWAGIDHWAHVGVVGWLLLAVGPLALVVRRRHPVAVLWVAFAATLAPSGARFAYLSLIVAFFVAATSGHRRVAWAVIVVGYVSSLWIAPLAYGNPAASRAGALLLAAWLAVLVIAAEAVRMRRERAAETHAARQLEQRRRASEERLRMARDLHDVIGHNISLISVQAGVGLDLMESQPEQAHAALSAIKTVSKEALDELRAMLGALRQDGDEAPRSPVPGLARLPELVELTRAAGLSIEVETIGEPRPLPTATDLAAYRIIQESLTNVARHAGPAGVSVRVSYGDDSLIVEVADDGRGPSTSGTAGSGSGSGIAGMRERATTLGGTFSAGFRPEGGFAVSARLPIGEPS
jgi:signal transduction histidine kinase